jgi:hypothetical protein
VSLLFTVVVWGCGVAASVAGDGTVLATSALGYASATAQLAAVPLIVAVTWAVSAAQGAGAARIGALLASVVVVTASACMVVGYDPSGDSYIALAGVIALGVGVWLGTALWQYGVGRAGEDRVTLSVAGAVGGAVLYASLCSLPGGLGLLLASGYLVAGGRRGGPVSPARLPASS